MKQARTKQEVIDRLNALPYDDYEAAHEEADSLLCDALLLSKGMDIVDAFLAAKKRLHFQYA